MKVSSHAKYRIRERTDLNHNERKMLFRYALNNGKSLADIKNKEIYDYVNEKQNIRKCKIKLYKGYLFVYSKNRKILYTMYKLPKELGDEIDES